MSLKETIQQLPIYKQLVAQAEAKRQQKREQLVARRREIEAERDQRLPVLIRACEKTDRAVVEAREALRNVQRARYQAHGARAIAALHYERQIARIDAQLQALASEPISEFIGELDKEIEALRSPVSMPEEKKPPSTGWGYFSPFARKPLAFHSRHLPMSRRQLIRSVPKRFTTCGRRSRLTPCR